MYTRDSKKIVISAAVFALLSQVIHTVSAIFTMSYYTNPAYFPLWSKIMMPTAGPPGTEFYVFSIIASFITGLVFAGAYSILGRSVPESAFGRGINYGIMLFLIAGVPFTFTTYLLLAVPSALLLAWAFESLVIYVIAGAAFEKILR